MPSISRLTADVSLLGARDLHDPANIMTTNNLFAEWPHELSNHASGLGSASSVNASLILAAHQRHEVQILAMVTSSLSVIAALCAIYWFCMMRRNYRRDLVLMLICADFWKSLWYMIYSSIALAHGQSVSATPLCQASGYFLQVGIQACDLVILFMSVHMSLQIFPPANSFIGHDGLYRVRYFVVTAWIILPNITASLAFLNPQTAYVATGPFCYLPIRPYWYRIALAWGPRYLIWIYIMGVAIRIYRHVGKEFEVFGLEKDGSTNTARASTRDETIPAVPGQQPLKDLPGPDGPSNQEQQGVGTENIASDDSHAIKLSEQPERISDSIESLQQSSSGRLSPPQWSTAFTFPGNGSASPLPQSSTPSRRGSHAIATGVLAKDFAPPSTSDLQQHWPSVVTLNSIRSHAQSLESERPLALILEDKRNSRQSNASRSSGTHRGAAADIVQTRRRAIQRQLRLLFIYPITYLLLWIIPFITHCFNYSDYYAQHPIFVLGALNTFCQCFLGFTDVCIFCWREKPWRHVPGSDGTFLGSFSFWQLWQNPDWTRRTSQAPSNVPAVEVDKKLPIAGQSQQQEVPATLRSTFHQLSTSFSDSPSTSYIPNPSTALNNASPLKPIITHRRTLSGGSDRRHLDIEYAHRRLALERAEYEANRKSLVERRASVISVRAAPKEWWDHLHDEEEDLMESAEECDDRVSSSGGVAVQEVASA